MPIQSYPFLLPTQNGAQIYGQNSRPFLWVRITNPANGRAVITLALIDTGADACAFPAETACALGHDLHSVPYKKIHTANRETNAFPHTSRLEILDVNPDGSENKDRVLYTIAEQLIDYTEGLGAFLLGRKDFLERFVVKIDYPKQKFSLRLPETKKKNRR